MGLDAAVEDGHASKGGRLKGCGMGPAGAVRMLDVGGRWCGLGRTGGRREVRVLKYDLCGDTMGIC